MHIISQYVSVVNTSHELFAFESKNHPSKNNFRKDKHMKQKKAHASHPVGNRTVIGIICIVVALAICFGIAPLVNRLSDGKTKIVRLTRDISAGATITEADIEVVDVGSYNLPIGVIKDKAQVVGKCALSNLKNRIFRRA